MPAARHTVTVRAPLRNAASASGEVPARKRGVPSALLALLLCLPAGAAAHAQSSPDYKMILLRNFYPPKPSLSQSAPVYKTITDELAIGGGAGNFFSNPHRLGLIEISPLVPVRHSTVGPAWMACLRTNPDGQRPTTDAVFFVRSDIVDLRTSVLSDKCGSLAYERLARVQPPKPRPHGARPDEAPALSAPSPERPARP